MVVYCTVCACCSGLENLIKTQKDKLAELQECLRTKEADLEKVHPYQAGYCVTSFYSDQGAVY